MDSTTDDLVHDFPPFLKVYKDGRVERYAFMGTDPIPAGLDPKTGVQSKDVVISPETGVKARIFMPKIDQPGQKLPLLIHYHGGGFCIGSALDKIAWNFLTYLVSQGNMMAISVEYRLAPEHPLPIAYDDSWAGLQWVASHFNGSGPEPWINEHADLHRVFLLGESAGANITHNVAVRAGAVGLVGLKVVGILMVHPFFGGKETDEKYKYLCPTSSGRDDDPRLNPAVDPNLSKMACQRVMVFVAEKDWLRNRGQAYYETLGKSGWGGTVEFFETKGEEHCFHMFKNNEEAEILKKKMIDFIKVE
ncbi:hypothetical protein SLE2022_158560 [Rubroshorea leprosula]